MREYLFIGAHPDDIEFGCGGTIAKATNQGISCHTLVFSDCHESLPIDNSNPKVVVSESIEALKSLGVLTTDMSWLDFPVRNFHLNRSEILNILIKNYRGGKWEKVFLPSEFDVHQDHAVCTQEGMRAFKFHTIYGYELPWNNYHSDIRFFNVLNNEQVEQKCKALAKFKTQKSRYYADEEKIRGILSFRGLQVEKPYAEGFQLIRQIQA